MDHKRHKAIQNSHLWAAWADALGFISELATQTSLRKRIKEAEVRNTQPWTRRIGGRFGAHVSLDAGTYSDDTQLRIASSRAIRADGSFDAEAFARVELPVFLSYSLGAGIGTREAAKSLKSGHKTWYSNFFESKRRSYTQCGGNGAAMRIQPHVWCSPAPGEPHTYTTDVFRNAITTHGHPRGFLGAILFAYCLGQTIDNGRPASFDTINDSIEFLGEVPGLVKEDRDIRDVWLPTWEGRFGMSLADTIQQTQNELFADLQIAIETLDRWSPKNYVKLLDAIGGFDRETRGSGTKTALLALSASQHCPNEVEPYDLIRTVVNALGSDTDTIATMSGALIGTLTQSTPPTEVQDSSFLVEEAKRLYQISQSATSTEFAYPNLLDWKAPRSQVDAVLIEGERVCVAGLGTGDFSGEIFESMGNNQSAWQKIELDSGQTLYAKRRLEPRRVESCPSGEWRSEGGEADASQQDLFIAAESSQKRSVNHSTQDVIDTLSDEAINNNFDRETIGRHIRILARDQRVEDVIGYAAIIAKAIKSRISD